MSFDWLFNPQKLETTETAPDALVLRRETKRRTVSKLKREKAAEAFEGLPDVGESVHIVSNGRYDFWSLVPVLIERIGGTADEFYGSTWTMNRENVVELFGLMDAGKIRAAAVLTGVYFKRRESSVYATLVEGMMDRGGRFIAFENHAKILLLSGNVDGSPSDGNPSDGNPSYWLVIEGSANFTANPRLEQYVFSNDKMLYDFHRGWMDKMLSGKGDGRGNRASD